MSGKCAPPVSAKIPRMSRKPFANLHSNCLYGNYGPKNRSSAVLDVAKWLGVFAVGRVRFARGTARNQAWRELERLLSEWASRSLVKGGVGPKPVERIQASRGHRRWAKEHDEQQHSRSGRRSAPTNDYSGAVRRAAAKGI